jgi:hypothetical protein
MFEHIEFLVEEPSMEAALRQILPSILGHTSFAIYPHQGKQDLLQSLPRRLQGYRSWIPDDWAIVVVVDRDSDDCRELKRRLERSALDLGLPTRSQPRDGSFQVVNRIAIEELEAWFFGDWEAVRQAFPAVSRNVPNNHRYRDPDGIAGGTWEALEGVLRKAGYFKTGLRKIEVAQAIAARMDPALNRSRSFQVFRDVVRELAT